MASKSAKITFYCYGHRNILGTHKTTLEFTKDKELTKNGNCIIGIGADFELNDIRKLLEFDNIRIKIIEVNKNFSDNHEIVVRMGEYDSGRTLGVRADKASIQLKREIMEKMKDPKQKMIVEIEGYNQSREKIG